MGKHGDEPPEDAWNRIMAELTEVSDDQLWQQLAGMAGYRGGDAEQNLTLAALVHTLADRDEQACAAFESWKQGPDGGGDSGPVVAWMLEATGRLEGSQG
ncbi:hypothetical protein SAMN05216215_105756 [Saccharopolyspora shandongensis]|uniref:Uncharacterized protein n=2 Tax=Saccharopolyspora shandongensis TaxID=418495 RepID=A0A1H3RTD0_9PSEU|nr:hypothetical protein SAMN05216215_105756 [Saccharopolyspora shandongensis]